jgi:hypothetical protein
MPAKELNESRKPLANENHAPLDQSVDELTNRLDAVRRRMVAPDEKLLSRAWR